MLLIKSQLLDEPLNLDELMQYSLTPVPPSIGTPDGFFAKTNKASMLHFLLADTTEEVPYPKDAIYIQDGMALWYVLINLPQTCGDICLQVLDLMAAKKNFVFSPTVTMQTLSRHRRDCAVASYRSTSLMAQPPGSLQTVPCQQGLNKRQLCQLLLQVWGSKLAASSLEKQSSSWMGRHISWTHPMVK